MKKRKYIFIPLTLMKKQWASKLSTSPKEKLELGKVLKVEIGEIRVIAPLVFDFFLFFFPTNVFLSQADVIPGGSLSLIILII